MKTGILGNDKALPQWKRFVVVASVLALMLVLLPANVASAEPDHTATLNRDNPKFTWQSSGSGVTGSLAPPGFRCTGAPFRCEYILLDVEKDGELTLTLDNTSAVSDPTVCSVLPCESFRDINGYLYRSTPAGEPLGPRLTPAGDLNGCATGSPVETCKVAVTRGFYLIEVEYRTALEGRYIGTAELGADEPGPPADEPRTIALEGCNFTLYYFKDSAERLQTLLPPGYRVRPYGGRTYPWLGSPLVATEGSATIAAAAYDCESVETPGAPSAPAIFTVLSVLVFPPGDETAFEAPSTSDYYVLWIHANNPHLVELLASRGMPADYVPGMLFEKPLQSLAVRVEVPWSQGAYELATRGFAQDPFHSHDNTYWHDAADGRRCQGRGAAPSQRGCVARMDFVTSGARDQHCARRSDHHDLDCGKLTAQAGTPVASFFGAADRIVDTAWDHDPMQRSWFILH